MAGTRVYFTADVTTREKHSPWLRLENISLVDIPLTTGEVSDKCFGLGSVASELTICKEHIK
jgi:hypothetical protein